jgi:hypothetical protein
VLVSPEKWRANSALAFYYKVLARADCGALCVLEYAHAMEYSALSPTPCVVVPLFRQTARLVDGHVAVVSRVMSAREIRVDHANWDSRRGGGPISLDQPVLDVSAANDWTAVRVWYPAGGSLGITIFPTAGFVLPRPAGDGTRQT